jgi:hypothetical protein
MKTFNFNSKRFRQLSERVFLDLHSRQCLNGAIVYMGFTLRDIPHFESELESHVIKHVRLYKPTISGNFKLVKNKYVAANRKLAA